MDTVQCFLCSDDLCSSTSRINVRGRSSFPIEEEIKKLPISARIDDNTRICPACLRKLRKKKSLEENLQEAIRDLVKNHNPVVSTSVGSSLPRDYFGPNDQSVKSIDTEFVPLFVCTPKKSVLGRSNCSGNGTSCQPKQTEPGVTVGTFICL